MIELIVLQSPGNTKNMGPHAAFPSSARHTGPTSWALLAHTSVHGAECASELIQEVVPRQTIRDPQSALDVFLRARTATIDYVRATKEDLRGHFAQSPMDGFTKTRFSDAYRWLLRMSAHTERHLMQVHELRRSDNLARPAAVKAIECRNCCLRQAAANQLSRNVQQRRGLVGSRTTHARLGSCVFPLRLGVPPGLVTGKCIGTGLGAAPLSATLLISGYPLS